MYRVIFLFDIDDAYPFVMEAATRLLQRRPANYTPEELTECWFRMHLEQDLNLALLESGVDRLQPLLDIPFQMETQDQADRLYRHLNLAVYKNAHPCLESWCAVKVNRFTLFLTFDVGPIDYGARLA